MITLPMFRRWLKDIGYSDQTKNGRSSVAMDYARRINKICEHKNISLEILIDNINEICISYSRGGKNEKFGNKGHGSNIAALKKFRLFISYNIIYNHQKIKTPSY